MRKFLLLVHMLLMIKLNGQNIGIGTTAPDASAILHLNSNSKGLIVPRMLSAEKLAITSPADGLLVYDTDTKSFWYYNGSLASWIEVNSSNVLPAGFATNTLRHDGTSWVADTYLSNDGSRIGIGQPFPTEGLHIDSSMKIGNSVWISSANSRFLKFGDGNFINIGEDSADDRLQFRAKEYVFGKSSSGYSGNVGIGVSGAPTAKLHVNGTVRITDGNQAAGRVLTSDASGNASWQEASCMQHRVVYATPGGGQSFTVPAGVTRVFVEIWSGGGNGSAFSASPAFQVNGGGGGSGAYANLFVDVTPASTISLIVGSVASGFNSGISYGALSISLNNGSNADNLSGPGSGGTLLSNNFSNTFISKGKTGDFNLNTVYTIGATTYTEYRGGKGGDAPFGGFGGAGEVARSGFNSGSDTGAFPGGGGGASTSNGTTIKAGGNGAVIIRY